VGECPEGVIILGRPGLPRLRNGGGGRGGGGGGVGLCGSRIGGFAQVAACNGLWLPHPVALRVAHPRGEEFCRVEVVTELCRGGEEGQEDRGLFSKGFIIAGRVLGQGWQGLQRGIVSSR
jgi:hypothetical protein